jgi:hypothetical protein
MMQTGKEKSYMLFSLRVEGRFVAGLGLGHREAKLPSPLFFLFSVFTSL